MGDFGADPALVASPSNQSSLSRPSGFDPGDEIARYLVASEFERKDYPTVAYAIRSGDHQTLAIAPGVAVSIVGRIFEAAQGIDYFEGNGGDFADRLLAALARIEASGGDGTAPREVREPDQAPNPTAQGLTHDQG